MARGNGTAVDEGEIGFRALVEQGLDLLYVIDADGVFRYASPAFERATGWRPTELVGASAFDLVHPDDVPAARAALAAAATTPDGIGDVQCRVRLKDGSWRWFEILGRNRCHDPAVRGVLCHVRDLAARRAAETALDRFFTLSPDPLAILGADGTVHRLNAAWRDTFGGEPDEAAPRLLDVVHPDDVPRTDAALRGTFERAEVVAFDNRVRAKDGTYRWLAWRAVASPADGLVYATARDVTDRRRTEAFQAGQTWVLELLATGASLDDVLAALVQTVEEQVPGMRCSILLLDAEGRRLHHGAAPSLPEAYCKAIDGLEIGPDAGSCGTAAYRRERVAVADVTVDPRWERFRNLALAHGLRACWSEPIIAADGNVLGTLAMYYGEPRTPNRRETNLIVIAAHLAAIAIERKRAERELEVARDRALEAAQIKSQFLANVSHEVRTPMNAIIGMTDLTLETELTAEQREYLEVVRTSAHNLLALLDAVLDVARVEAGRLEIHAAPFAFRAELAGALEPLRQRAAQKGLRLVVDVDSAVPDAVVGDAGRLRQVVTNLVANGIKFTEAGEVAVRVGVESTTAAGPIVHVAVADTGIGIPPTRLRGIFRPFEQADGSTTRRFGGAGLGLALAAQVVERMGGGIWVESEPGRGSVFHFTVPLALAPASPAATTNGAIIMTTDRTPPPRDVIDGEALLELVGGDGDALADLVELYRAEAPRSIDALRTALAQADAAALSAAAHRLKGSLLTLAAHEASAEALRLEQLGRDGRLAAIEPALQALVERARRGAASSR